jgi:hypothetical protein
MDGVWTEQLGEAYPDRDRDRGHDGWGTLCFTSYADLGRPCGVSLAGRRNCVNVNKWPSGERRQESKRQCGSFVRPLYDLCTAFVGQGQLRHKVDNCREDQNSISNWVNTPVCGHRRPVGPPMARM